MLIKQKNILLDSEFHCQITGFSLTQHVEASVPQALAVPVNYAAPELLEICNICWQIQCGLKCSGAQPMKQRKKTTEADVYAFGCLYYNVSPMTPSAVWLMVTGTDVLWYYAF